MDSLASFLEEAGSSSLMILVDGKVAFEWGEVDRKHLIHSMRKALLNSLYGIAIERRQIDTTWTLREVDVNDIEPRLSDAELEAKIADLLKSKSGVYHDAAAVHDGMLANRPERDTFKPGENFYYNNWDFNALGGILEQKTGQSIYTMFLEEIAKPLGMLDYAGTFTEIDGEADEFVRPKTDGYYQYERTQSKYPAYHFRMSTRDLALYGQLYLQKGKWEDKQIVPAEWIEQSTRAYSVTDTKYGIGYGMLWRVLMKTENRPSTSFYHTGLGIHMLAVYPASNMVLVHRVDTENDYSFHDGHFFQMIRMVWGARSK